jgi:hypothetical protein
MVYASVMGFIIGEGVNSAGQLRPLFLNINEVLLLFIQKITTHQIFNNQFTSKHPLLSLHPI